MAVTWRVASTVGVRLAIDRKNRMAGAGRQPYPWLRPDQEEPWCRRFDTQESPVPSCAEARQSMRSPQYGHPAQQEVATGYGPCRHCLRTFRIGEEERLLFTYQPIQEAGGLPAPGPVFVHAGACERYDGPDFPPDLVGLPLGGRGVPDRRDTRDRRSGWPAEPPEVVVARVLGTKDVAYAHLRNAEAGCFMARVARVGRIGTAIACEVRQPGRSPANCCNPLGASPFAGGTSVNAFLPPGAMSRGHADTATSRRGVRVPDIMRVVEDVLIHGASEVVARARCRAGPGPSVTPAARAIASAFLQRLLVGSAERMHSGCIRGV